jgi:hypothetical protein
MPTTKTVYLSNPSVTIGGVDVTQNTSAASLEIGYDSLESTTFGDTGHRFVSGLQMVNVTLTMFQNYGTGEIEATLMIRLATAPPRSLSHQQLEPNQRAIRSIRFQ